MRLVLHAPNVHIGGGFELLRSLLAACKGNLRWAQLDERTKGRWDSGAGMEVHYVSRTVVARLAAEWRLWRKSRPDDLVLCFHGMPPLLPIRSRVSVYVQNSYLLGLNSLREMPIKVALRIGFERALCKLLRRHVDEYLVQTKTMAEKLRLWHGGDPCVRILPFANLFDRVYTEAHTADDYDFIYVADGLAHKNHHRLIDAWLQLAEAGLFPSLALTLGSENPRLLSRLQRVTAETAIRVYNLGVLPKSRVVELYQSAGALIYPSTSESFGLPLVEAAASGLPIVAAELDYVRDVVTPVETFDPQSPTSIARAVRRFLGCPEAPGPVLTANEFVGRLLQP